VGLKIIEGAVDGVGDATPMTSETGPTGVSYAFVRFARLKRKPVTLDNVVADTVVGGCIAPGNAGRFAFYSHGKQSILCGFSDGNSVKLVPETQDPVAMEADIPRTAAKRKIFFGILLIPTIIGIVHGFEMIRRGRFELADNPAPKRPSEARLTLALTRRRIWPFQL